MSSVMLDLISTELSAEENELLRHPQVGGVILFSRNYESREQLAALMHNIRTINRPSLLVAVDQEGGRVQRFRAGFSELPPLGDIGQLYSTDKQAARQYAEKMGHLMASEILAFSIDFSFSPVLDLDKGISQIIGNRAFASQPDVVIDLARAYCKGMQKAGMSAVGKHFPGHGSVAADSHLALPVDSRTMSQIAAEDLLPFQKLIADNILSGIMPAHIFYPEVDAQPAGFSKRWLQEILRKQLAFNGAIFSDDLSMTGATFAGDIITRVQLALEAGCDMVLVCNDRKNAINVIEDLEKKSYQQNPQSGSRLQKMRVQSNTL